MQQNPITSFIWWNVIVIGNDPNHSTQGDISPSTQCKSVQNQPQNECKHSNEYVSTVFLQESTMAFNTIITTQYYHTLINEVFSHQVQNKNIDSKVPNAGTLFNIVVMKGGYKPILHM